MMTIAREARDTPDVLRAAPHASYVRRLDETTAAKKPILRWTQAE
jgi:glycine dehydrogenase subunit 2